ncbi:MAG: right-handed parallel beta-helix repeat-containing protein, partial [Bacteroidota bacterium]|nr:right-handed parallel beta-helix repeat-containing protein [Bacteroidota bacterium]
MIKNFTHFPFRKQLLFCLLVFGISAAQAQTDYYVSNAGNNSNNGLSPAAAKATIPAAINIAADGDIIHIANGTYTLTATLNLNHELTILGESETGVIINASGTPAGAWAINPNKSNTYLGNFTLIPNGTNGGFPIHAGANTGNPLPVLTNISLSHITINGARKTAFDCNAIDHLNLSYLTATNTSNGNGVQISGCKYVTADHITTSHNSWGGFAVYVSNPYPSGVGRGSDQVSIDASNSSIGEATAVYSQNESGFVNTNITVTGFDFLVTNPVSASGYGFYYPNLSAASAAALAITNPKTSLIKEISSGNLQVVPGMSIQYAVTNAAVNTRIQIGAGDFHEDVNINKTILLQGAGMNVTTVYGLIGGGGATFQISANQVVIDGFGLSRDGNNTTDWNNAGLNFAGIAIANVGNAEIRNCKFFGNRTGIDINNSNGNYIHNNVISDNRTGLLFRNQTNNTRVLENEIDNNWTMGILFLDASNGTNSPVQSAANSVFSQNHISGNWYGQVVDRQAGGSLPAPGTQLKNFTCNWFGSLHPQVSAGNSVEPGYAAQIPVIYGGNATAPGGQPDILGAGSANIDYQPYLSSGVDNDPQTPGFQPIPNTCSRPLSDVNLGAITHNKCFGGSEGSVTVSYANGIGVVTYSLDNGTAIAAAGSPVTISGLSAGVHTITLSDATGSITLSASITQPAGPLPAAVLTVSSPDAFCKDITLSTADAGAGAVYQWMLGTVSAGSTQSISLGQENADGLYSLTVFIDGCVSTPATYLYQKQKLVNSYTVLALREASFGENNTVASGSVGVIDQKGSASFHKNSSVSSPGSFVKASRIRKDGQNIQISQPVYAAATDISLPTMYKNLGSPHRLSNREVSRNSVSTLSGNYRNLVLKKGSRTTLTGNTFGTILVEQGAQVSFTANMLYIDRLEVQKGPRFGYSYVRFAPDTKVMVSGSVTIGSQVYLNPDNYKVTFYLGDAKSDDERFTVKGGDTRVTANVYLPDGKLKVTGGYGYGDRDNDDDDDRYFGQGNSTVYMTGLFIAEEVESSGKNVVWNSFDCNAAPVPVLNSLLPVQITQSATQESATPDNENSLS